MSVPILYETSETKFINQGLGALTDALSCVVTEERNSSYELKMVYPTNGIHYEDIKLERIISAVPAERKKPQPFRIYKITKPINGKVEILAEHISYQLSFIPVEPFTASSCVQALQGLKNNSKEYNPFTFYTDIDSNEKYTQYVPASLRSRLAGSDGSIYDVYGDGEFEFDNYTVRFLQHRGNDNGVVIEYGKNLTDLKQEENIQNTVTGIFPYWENNDYGKMHVVMLPERVLETEYADRYPFKRTISKSFADKFYDAPTESKLREVANEYIKKELVGVPEVNLTVSFINLADTEEYKDLISEDINLCDIVTVYFPSLGVSAKAKVVTTEYDVLADRYNSIQLSSSNTTSSFADTINDIQRSIDANAHSNANYTQEALNHATELLTGGLGGNVVVNYIDDRPSEILVMDTPNKNTAKYVIRINMNGIGFSSNGYIGPFNSAWTIDSQFVADFITTGTLRAGLIKAGILSDAKGTNFWNMETGEFKLSSGAKIGNSTIASSKDISNFDESLNQMSVFNRLTNNGQIKGIYMSDGSLFINADYIKSGTMSADLIRGGTYICGGKNNGNGKFTLRDSQDTDLISIDSSGLTAKCSYNGSDYSCLIDNNGLWVKGDGYGFLRTMLFSTEQYWSMVLTMTSGDGKYISNMSAGAFEVYHLLNSSGNVTNVEDLFYAGVRGLICKGTKSRIVDTEDYGNRLLYCYETPSPMFGDIGEGVIGDDGQAFIQIDPTFAETINTSQYQVFLQKYGKGDCYISERHSTYFIIKGDPGLSFGWEIKAKQNDFDQMRLETFYNDEPQGDNTNYGATANEHIKELNEGRLLS